MSKSIKFPDEHYIGFVARDQSEGDDKDFLPLAFATPNGTDKAAEKRRDSVDGWVARNSTGYDHKTRTQYKIKQPKPVVLKNEAMAGFRLLDEIRRNSGWGSGNVKWRVEDPRGFELEISSPNLMQILACSVVDNGEILDMCMWAREGGDNVLVPVTSEVYTSAMVNTERAAKSASLRDLKIGDHVLLQNGESGIWYGKMNSIEHDYARENERGGPAANLHLKLVPRHIFINDADKTLRAVASPKLAEIHPREEIDRDTAEQIVARIYADPLYTKTGSYYTQGYTFSKAMPVVTREKTELTWDENVHSQVFEVNGVWYCKQYYGHGDEIQAEEILTDAWVEGSYVRSRHTRDQWSWNRHFNKFSRKDLMARGIKCYRPSSRITTDKGIVYLVRH